MMQENIYGQTLPSGLRLGDYVIDRTLKSGGFGITYIAHEREGGRKVVIKENMPRDLARRDPATLELHPLETKAGEKHDYDWALESFLRDANLLVTLDHPHIVKVLYAFSALNTAYYVMPYAGGVSLEQWRAENGRPDKKTMLHLQRTLLSALAHVHAHNLLHRDVKPDNILIQEDGEPLLIDFGAARQIVSPLSVTLIHTPGFTPPEQMVSGGKCGPWSDLYSLGATLHVLLTGECPPVGGTGTAETARPHFLSADPGLVAEYGECMLTCIDKALLTAPEDRWQSAADWLRALERGKTPNLRRRVWRRRTAFAAGGVAIAVAAGVCTWLLAPASETVAPAPQPAPETIDPATRLLQAAGSGDLPRIRQMQDAKVLEGMGADDLRGAAARADGNGHAEAYALLLRVLAERGHAQSQNDLGLCYRSGKGVERNSREAVKWFRAAAEQGNADALYNLGLCYEIGIGMPPDPKEAVTLYRAAGEQEHVDALQHLSKCYRNGTGVPKDEKEADRLWEMADAIRFGRNSSQLKENLLSVPRARTDGKIPAEAEDVPGIYFQAAKGGDAEAQYNLGVCYENGEGVEKNDHEAFKWYSMAADQGFAAAEVAIGSCYAHGRGVKQDDGKAVQWYTKAVEKGDADAQFHLGQCYDNGTGVEQDLQEAVRLYRLAAEQGLAKAQHNLAYCYDYGTGVEQDLQEAFKWYSKAAGQAYAGTQYALGLCYEFGKGVEKNDQKAVEWYRKAAEQGYANAQFNLGVHYKKGTGVEQDYQEAAYWYRKAADQGYAPAQFNLALHYENGYGVEKNDREAVYWYRKAADQGDKDAQLNLGICYATGAGVEEDPVKAVKWFRMSAEQGSAKAQYNLGVYYKNGTGVEQNKQEAVEWFRKAAAQGHAGAQDALKRLGQDSSGN